MDYFASWSIFNCIKLTICLFLLNNFQPVKGTNNGTQNTCKMLDTNRLSLDLACVLRLNAAHQLSASSKEECQKVCCDWAEGPCDLVYWGNSHMCVIMNYYVLGSCHLLASTRKYSITHSSYSLLLSITTKTPATFKKYLLKDYRNDVQSLLGCSSDEFVCDNWDCIPYKQLCDGVAHCSDKSDESSCPRIVVLDNMAKCLDYTGIYVGMGSGYTPMNETDTCQTCICGANGQPSYCFSATCDRKILSDCDVPHPDICCRCQHDRGIIEPDHFDTENAVSLSSTQRLIVSCMSVLVLITLLLFFSRNLVNRGRLLHGGQTRRTHVLAAPRFFNASSDDLPPNRSFIGRYWRSSDSVSFFDDHDYMEAPPAYNMLKINGETLGPPPSYPPSVQTDENQDLEVDTSQVTDNPTTSQEPGNTNLAEQQPIENQPESAVSMEPVEEPISPLSTTSQSPLLNNNDENIV